MQVCFGFVIAAYIMGVFAFGFIGAFWVGGFFDDTGLITRLYIQSLDFIAVQYIYVKAQSSLSVFV